MAVVFVAISFTWRLKQSAIYILSTYKKGDHLDDIIRRADDHLYRAKQSGRNQTAYDKDMLKTAS